MGRPIDVVPVGRLFGLAADDPHQSARLPMLADAAIDYGPVDLLLYLRVRTLGDLLSRDHALRPEAKAEWEALVRDRRAALFVDYASEGPPVREGIARRFGRLIRETGLPPRAIWFAQTNRRFARDLRTSPHATPPARGIAHIESHWFATMFAERAKRRRWSMLGRANLDAVQPAGRRVLLCLNGTPRPHRAALAYLLSRHRHRDRIFLTFHATAGPKIGLSVTAGEAGKLLAATGVDAHDLVDALAAHAFDVDTSDDNEVGRRDLTLSPDLYRGTQASLVTETDLSDGSIVRYTEKALKPLLMGHPIVVLGNPRTLRLLEDLGFDVFRDVIEAGYDTVADPVERFRAVLGVVDRLLAAPPAWPWPPAVKERLLANLALFDGPLLDTLKRRERQSIEAAARRMA